MLKKNIVIYGATGSIGESTLNLIRVNKENFNVVGLTCNENITKIINIANEFDCKNIGIANKELITKNKTLLHNYNIFAGIDEFQHIISNYSVDIIIFAISGSAPLQLLMELSSSGKCIGLANKECIICLGNLFLDNAALSSTKIVPLDSEHNALYQLIKNKNLDSIKKYTITASGGNFYKYHYQDLMNITPEQAVIHPKWKMGKKITVDSSTLMNKMLELIEAQKLFDIPDNKIDILIHPNSLVHAIIKLKNGLTKFIYHETTMIIPLANALFEGDFNIEDFYNKKIKKRTIENLTFDKVNAKIFPIIKLKKRLNECPSTPIIINAANEILVDQFLQKKIPFLSISKTILSILNDRNYKKYAIRNPENIKDIIKIDKWARETIIKRSKIHD